MCESESWGLAVKDCKQRNLDVVVGLWLEELTDLLFEFDLAPGLSPHINPSKVSGLLPPHPPVHDR